MTSDVNDKLEQCGRQVRATGDAVRAKKQPAQHGDGYLLKRPG